MTPKDAPRFFAQMARLAMLHRIEMDKPTGRLYFEALTDIPIETLEAAIDYLVKHAGEFMPKTEAIRATCDLVAQELHAAALAAIPQQNPLLLEGQSAQTTERTINLPGGPMTVQVRQDVSGYECSKCQDTGFMKQCTGCDDPSVCVRYGRRADDDYCGEYRNGKNRLPVTKCTCYETNPELLRRRALKSKAPSYTGGKGRPRRRPETPPHWNERD